MNDESKALEFRSVVNFSAQIINNKELLKKVPTLEVLAKLGQSLGKGCRCNLKKRRKSADEAYENILNYLKMNVIPIKPPVSQVFNVLNEAGEIIDEGVIKLMKQQIELLLEK